MSVSGNLGISPVLLQAISLKSSEVPAVTKVPLQQEQATMEKEENSKVVTHLLQGMNEPVSAFLTPQTQLTLSGDLMKNKAMKPQEVLLTTKLQERLASQLALKQAKFVTTSTAGGPPTPSDISMVNVLTALASQHRRANIKQEESNFTSIITPPTATTTAAADVLVRTNNDSVDDRAQPQIIIYYNGSGTVPSPGNDVVVGGEGEGERSVQNYRVVMQHGDFAATTVTTFPDPTMNMITDAAAAAVGTDIPGSLVQQAAGSNSVEMALDSNEKCPVCGDKLSGYHYGVITCESCKGFFKRTVQNNKTFVCHKQGECDINISNRKKCPACRFRKCLQAGMKLEAIRQDRTRGGRSSYEGCSHGKPKPYSTQKKTKRPNSTPSEEGLSGGGGGGVNPETEGLNVKEDGKAHRQLFAILNHSNTHAQQMPGGAGQRIPELLTDIMNLEALLMDDDIPLDTSDDDPTGEQAFYNYLMQLTELRLYKLVRWARNLPQFGAISTDDQILLLQNCWSDLLALGVCWRSVSTPNQLSISATRSITAEQAHALGFGDVVSRLLSIAEGLRNLHVDQFEYVALKVLLLITPDVKGLKEPSKIHDYQEKLSDALMEYTSSHYTKIPSKFGEMLLRLPELARVSFLAKEILLVTLPPFSTSCGLLVELLKGENAVKD